MLCLLGIMLLLTASISADGEASSEFFFRYSLDGASHLGSER